MLRTLGWPFFVEALLDPFIFLSICGPPPNGPLSSSPCAQQPPHWISTLIIRSSSFMKVLFRTTFVK